MKEKLYTIPLNDAVNANDECPFCFIERELEQNSLDFVLSYLETVLLIWRVIFVIRRIRQDSVKYI